MTNWNWEIGESIAMELDVALAAMLGAYALEGLPDELAQALRSLPADWQPGYLALFQPAGAAPARGLRSVMELAAGLAGVLTLGDYTEATLAIRETTISQALERWVELAGRLGLTPQAGLPPAEQLEDLALRTLVGQHQAIGLELSQAETFARRLRHDLSLAVQTLRDGALSARFWHFMDRFYYEAYRAFRQQAEGFMEQRRQQLLVTLGAPSGSGPVPLDWLPAQNPLLRIPELAQAAAAGQLSIFFWIEPIGLADFWSLWPGRLVVSSAQPGNILARFHEFAQSVAGRTQALGDPTRLIILRMIRHFPMVNTEIAAYLGLSRPTVSVHAKILREAGLIRSWQDGRLVRHEIVPAELRRLFKDLERFLDLPEE